MKFIAIGVATAGPFIKMTYQKYKKGYDTTFVSIKERGPPALNC